MLWGENDNGLKSSIFTKVDVLLITGSTKYHFPQNKSRAKICTFQSVIIDPDRQPKSSLCICSRGSKKIPTGSMDWLPENLVQFPVKYTEIA